MRKTFAVNGLILCAAVLLAACSGSVTGPTKTGAYTVAVVLVKNLSDGSARIDMTLQKNDSTYKKAVVTLGTTTLDTNVLGYTKSFTSTQILVGQTYSLNIHDSTSLNYNINITLPGPLTGHTTNLPVNRVYSGGAVAAEWTVATGTAGYILATTPPAGAITDSGYEAYSSSTSESIPTSAFFYNQVAISGTHTVYMAAYTGAPTLLPAVPFAIPVANNPADNISVSIVKGRASGMVVAAPDSVVVP